MEKEFIPYEQALALKELVFDDKCISTITNYNYLHIKGTRGFPSGGGGMVNEYKIDCPTFSQSFRWFRENYGLHFVINVGIPHDNITQSKKIQYFFNVVKCGKHHKGIFRSIFYTTYEEAELECLKKLIEIVKEK